MNQSLLIAAFSRMIMILSFAVIGSCSFDEEDATIFDESSIIERRKEIDEFFLNDASSPLHEEQKKEFKGLQYFPPSEDYAFYATFVKASTSDTVQLLTSKAAEKRSMIMYGTLSFSTQDGTQLTLTAYKSTNIDDEILFVPFKDKTNGFETYEAGRYVELEEIPNEDEYLLDFNRAYNPYCAYNKDYSCPLVPKNNVLSVAIKAGEKRPAFQ
ncbi:MAG: DUF1684 domain-containing protein [bacterium]